MHESLICLQLGKIGESDGNMSNTMMNPIYSQLCTTLPYAVVHICKPIRNALKFKHKPRSNSITCKRYVHWNAHYSRKKMCTRKKKRKEKNCTKRKLCGLSRRFTKQHKEAEINTGDDHKLHKLIVCKYLCLNRLATCLIALHSPRL